MPKRLPRSRTLKGDPKLAYYDSGGGVAGEPAIVLVHGATMRSEDWENIFPRLATRYRVIAYDARGHGKSARAADYGIDALAADVLRVAALAGGPVVAIGHSLGGATALLAASHEPAAFRALVLEDPIRSLYRQGWRGPLYAALRAALERQGDPAALRAAVARLPLPSPGPRGERTVGEVRGFYSAERLVTYYATLDPAFVDAFMAAGSDPEGRAALLAARVTVPTLLLAADAKESALAEGEADMLARDHGMQLVRFPGVGHRIHGVRPEPFLEALEPFLRKVRAVAV